MCDRESLAMIKDTRSTTSIPGANLGTGEDLPSRSSQVTSEATSPCACDFEQPQKATERWIGSPVIASSSMIPNRDKAIAKFLMDGWPNIHGEIPEVSL